MTKGVRARRWPWVLSFGLILFAAIYAAPSLGRATWLEGRTGNFTVYSDGDEAGLRASLAVLEDHRRLLRLLTGKTPAPDAPLKIAMVASRERFAETFTRPPEGQGFYVSSAGGMAAIILRSGARESEARTLRHEYTHYFLVRNLPGYHSPWYAEGFADYAETAAVAGHRAELGRPPPGHMALLSNGTWLPMERLLFDPRRTPEEEGKFYAQSWLLVHYLLADAKRRAALETYLRHLSDGAEARSAFRQAFGQEARQLEGELRRYLAGGPASTVLTLDAAPGPTIAIRRLPPAADQLLLPHLTLSFRDKPTDPTRFLQQVRREAARFPRDPYASRVLAHAEIAHGDRAAGGRLTKLLLKSAPQDAELLYARGLANLEGSYQRSGRPERLAAACPWFEKAHKADPLFYAATFRLGECEFSRGAREKGLAYILRAQAQAPMVGSIALTAAAHLSVRGRHAEARRMLLPFAAHPQSGAGREARQMLGELPKVP
jgi:hypothetical protein